MAEYIEREAAINFVEKYTPNFDGETTMQCVKTALENVPTVDVKEVIHAKWTWKELYGEVGYMLVCSECEESEGACERYDYCPNCGAKMDKD